MVGRRRLVRALVAYAVLTLLPCAVVGALVAGPALRAMMPGRGRQAGAAGRDTYLAALRAMLAFGALSVLAVVLFRDADPLLWRLVQAVIGGAPVPPFDASALRHASVALLVLALPGWMWAASIIAASYPRVYAGGRGYLKACAMAAVACAAVCLPLWGLALRAFPIVLAQW
jgi:hypothetical protein